MRVVVVGATGAVGTEILRILEQRSFPLDELVPVATPRSAGRKLTFDGDAVEVRALGEDVFDAADIALFDVPDDVAREWGPVATATGAVVVDNSAAFRLDDDVPLVVPEINPDAVSVRPKGIVASPNCTTLSMVLPLAALHEGSTVERVIVASYQAASGAGKPGVDELWDQTERIAKEPDLAREGLARDVLEGGDTFVHPIAMNVVPRCGSMKEDGYTSEEIKLCRETRKIMGLPALEVTATCVRVPVMVGHGVAVHARFARPVTVDGARRALSSFPGIELVDDPEEDLYPTPLHAAGRDEVFVGRIRIDPFDDRSLTFFSVTDNLRKGAALNTVQVAELLAG